MSSRIRFDMARILVIKSRHIGDVLLTGPLIAALKAHYSSGEVHITALVKQGTRAMLQYHPAVDRCIVYPERRSGESKGHFLRRLFTWFRRLRRQKFDLAVTATEGDRGVLTAWLCGAPRRIGPIEAKSPRWHRWLLTEPTIPRPGRTHTVLRNLDLLPKEITRPYRRVDLGYLPGRHDRRALELLTQAGYRPERPLAVVHPTARWFFKCWTDAGMAAVIDHLQTRRGVQVVLTRGPAAQEREKHDAILDRCAVKPMTLADDPGLLGLAALISEADLFVGVDSAPMHMAAALDTPVVALFGPSGAWDWGPWPNGWTGGDTPYPAQNGVQRVGPHVVVQAQRPCVPCGQAGCDNSKRSACLVELPVAAVIREIDASLDRLDLPPDG